MKKSQQLQLQISEKRESLNTLSGEIQKIPTDQNPTEEQRQQLNSGNEELRGLETRFRAAVIQEDSEAEKAIEVSPDAEHREKTNIFSKCSIVPFLLEAAQGKDCSGPEHEYRQAQLGDEARQGLIPIEMLEVRAPERRAVEHRADAVTPVAAAAHSPGSQANVLERIFSRSIAARLLVSMPAVPVGQANFPVMLTGTTAAQQLADGAQDAGAGSFTGFNLDPVRLTARYLFRIEDVYKLRGLEDVLRRDLGAVMSDQMDNQVVNGDGTAPNVSGFIEELPDPVAAAATSTWATLLQNYNALVDGLNAYTLQDVRSVLGSDSYQVAEGVFRTATSDQSAAQYIQARTGGFSVSSRIPAAGNNKKQTNIAAMTSYPGRNAVAPIWRAIEVIRDNITGAATGQIAITALMLWNFKIVRETGFKLFEVQKA